MVLNRRNIQGDLFDKKRSKKKNGRDAQALTIYVTNVHPKYGEDEFSDWQYVVLVCIPNLSFDFAY